MDTLFDATRKPLKRDLAKLNRTLAKEKGARFPDERKIGDLEKQVEALNATIDQLKYCFYGVDPKDWWNLDPGWPEDHEAEKLRKEISEARREFHDRMTKIANHEGEDEYRMTEIDGVSFYSANFGVILDISGSMTPHIEKLKEEINENFQSPLYREVNGCRLSVNEQNGRFVAAGWLDTMSCVEEMLLIYKVDTIYWFCDLNDPRSEQALLHLGNLLRRSGSRLYLRSMKQKPDRDLKALIDDI